MGGVPNGSLTDDSLFVFPTQQQNQKSNTKNLLLIDYVMQNKGFRCRRGGVPLWCVRGFCYYVLCGYYCAMKGVNTQVANLVASFLVATVMQGCLFAHIYLQCFRGRYGGAPRLIHKSYNPAENIGKQLRTSENI